MNFKPTVYWAFDLDFMLSYEHNARWLTDLYPTGSRVNHMTNKCDGGKGKGGKGKGKGK